MSSLTTSDKPVAAAAAGAFALAVAYFSYSTAKKAANKTASSTAVAASSSSLSSKHANGKSAPAATAAHHVDPTMINTVPKTVEAVVPAPEPFSDADVSAFFAKFSANRDFPVVGASTFAAGGSSATANLMSECARLLSSDDIFNELKADAATDAVERAANLISYLEWAQHKSSKQSALYTPEQLSALNTLVDARVDTIEKWREDEAPMIRSVVRMLREIRDELTQLDDGTSTGSTDAGSSAGVVVTTPQTAAAVAGEDDESHAVAAAAATLGGNTRLSPEAVAARAADIRERVRRLRGILEKLHTPMRALGPVGELCNQLEGIATVLAGPAN